MVSKKFLLAILAITLVFGMTVIGCNPDDGGNTDPKSITITGVSGVNGTIVLFSSHGLVAMGYGPIASGTLTVDLLNEKGKRWTGSGTYIIELLLYSDDDEEESDVYMYTEGKTWATLGINKDTAQAQMMSKLPKYNISSTNSIAFSQFQKIPEGWMEYDDD